MPARQFFSLPEVSSLTVVGHAHGEALVEAAVLALVAVLLLDFAVAFTLVVLQLQPDGPPEETLVETRITHTIQNVMTERQKPREVLHPRNKKLILRLSFYNFA